MRFGNDALSPHDDPVTANSSWWSENATDYLAEYGETLGEADFIWGPEGLREADVEFLGDLSGKRVLEIGAGAAQCSRYLAGRSVEVVATDVAPQMVEHAKALNEKYHVDFPVLCADGRKLPFDDREFDVVFTSFGVLPFVPDLDEVNQEIARVLKPGGVWAYSALHPVRWMFPDDPTPRGMKVTRSYFSPEPYVERTEGGTLEYAEFHHSLTEHINSLTSCGFHIETLFEPPWPAGRDIVWGGWGPERSTHIPGTLMIYSRKN